MKVSILLKVLLYEALYHNVLAEVWADTDLLKQEQEFRKLRELCILLIKYSQYNLVAAKSESISVGILFVCLFGHTIVISALHEMRL